jgi:hypothetical protein
MSVQSILKVRGTIKNISDEQQFSPKFKKQSVALTTKDKYPQTIQIEFINDKIALLNGYMENEDVEISFNLRGNEFTNKQGKKGIITSLAAWKIDRLVGELTNAQQNNDRAELQNSDLPF